MSLLADFFIQLVKNKNAAQEKILEGIKVLQRRNDSQCERSYRGYEQQGELKPQGRHGEKNKISGTRMFFKGLKATRLLNLVPQRASDASWENSQIMEDLVLKELHKINTKPINLSGIPEAFVSVFFSLNR